MEEEDTSSVPNLVQTSTGENQIHVYYDNDGVTGFRMASRSKFAEDTQWHSKVVDFLVKLQDLIQEQQPEVELKVFTCYRRGDQMFRGHPNYRGKDHWRDWAMVDWGGTEGELPCHIWCFVVLEGLKEGRGAPHFGGIRLQNGTFGVVESGMYDAED